MASRESDKPADTKPPSQGEAKLQSYLGGALTSRKVAAIEAHVSHCEDALGPDCYPLTLSHGTDPRLPYRRRVYKPRTAARPLALGTLATSRRSALLFFRRGDLPAFIQ